MGWVKNVSMRCLHEQADSCCNNVQSFWWKLPLDWKLILNPPHRGRLRVTSATFNAAWVRDREKRVHHHQHFCWFEKIYFLSPRWGRVCTLPQHFQNDKRQKPKDLNPLPKVSIWGPRGEVSACGERRRTRRGSRRLLIWCCNNPPSDGAGSRRLSRPQSCQFPGLGNIFRDKIFLDKDQRRTEVLLFQFWTLTELGGWGNDNGCQWWSSFRSFRRMALEEIESLSKTTKLLLLDSLLQEVCIESGSDGSLALSSLGLSVCLVSHNLLYSGLKKAHLRIKFTLQHNGCLSLECITQGDTYTG